MELFITKCSKNSDRDYEYFWLTLKGIILGVVDDEIRNKINTISNELNMLQKHKEYDNIATEINLFLIGHIEYICVTLIHSKNMDIICRFSGNMKKWFTIMKERNIFLDLILPLNLI